MSRSWHEGEQAADRLVGGFGLAASAVLLSLVGYVTTVELISMVFGRLPLPMQPVTMLEPFRIANQYGLFAVMTRGRYEIEFQGSDDGQAWVAYPFRFKPQALDRAPGIYAPYQPRFEWNLWFASLGSWQQNPLVPRTEERLLTNDPDVLALFAGNPFAGRTSPPGTRRSVAVLVYFDPAKAHDRRLVDPPAAGPLCSGPGARRPGQGRHRRHAGRAASPRLMQPASMSRIVPNSWGRRSRVYRDSWVSHWD